MSEAETSIAQLRGKVEELERENADFRKKFEQIDRDRVEYLQNVSHQLVAPLNAIKWHIENITEGRISIERAKTVLKSVYSQATIAVHLAKNFNLMSNLETDHALTKLKEPLENIDLHLLMVNLANDFQPLAWDKSIDIIVDDEHFDSGPPVLAMKPLISQVFSNIIENSVKYSSSDTEIVIQGGYLSDSDCFSVTIRNQGIPLKPEYEKKIFERGFRCDEAKSKYPAGTGFGLYIARRIVEIHGGKITASTCNGWTVFEVILSVSGLKGKARVHA
jgi:signal transduction histidine kinase